MTKIAITTVGVSLFDNYEEKKEKIDIREQIKKDKAQTSVLKKFKETYTQKIVDWAKSAKCEACAEIKTLTKMGITNTYLLTTDTQEGELVGELLEQILPLIGICVIKKEKVEGLKVDDPNSFKDKGFFNLIKHIRDFKASEKKKENDVVLNGSGGYKAILPVLTIVGQLEDLELNYIYKDKESELITIPILPLTYDYEIMQNFVEYLNQDFLKNRNQHSIEEKAIIQKLIDYKLLYEKEEKKKNVLKTTTLGDVFIAYKDHIPTGKSVLGQFMEYKFYEYFNEFSAKYTKPTRLDLSLYVDRTTDTIYSTKPENISVDTLKDIDLKMLNLNGEVAICEVKSYDKTKKDYYEKIKHRILGYEHKFDTEKVKEFIFVIYKLKFPSDNVVSDWTQDRKYQILENFKENIKKDFGDRIKFVVKVCCVDLVSDKIKVNYTELLKNRIHLETIIQ